MIERVEVHHGAYYDSLSLMVLSRDAAAVDGVVDAAAVAGTPLNLELLVRQGFRLPPDQPTSSDIVVAIRAQDERAVDAADQLIRRWLTGRREEHLDAPEKDSARNVSALTRRNPEINLLLVSVPGRHATYEVAAGLEAGVHVFCFSSGMEISEERTLKALALEKGLLLLGPDCGTAILDGIGIGFANAVRAGPVGLVGASGTGMQEVSCLLDAIGIGISQAIGVGGRDLSADVGGLMTHRALDLLIQDPETGSIVVLSKPPDPSVADGLVVHAGDSSKPIVLGFLGSARSAPQGEGSELVQIVHSLEEAAARAAALHGMTLPAPQPTPREVTPGFVRGLFCGGSLCYEAMGILVEALGPVWSNTPMRPEWGLPAIGSAIGHTVLDFGDEVLTDGRPHPMIDPSLRNERALREALDPSVGVLLLDVVLGYGAHPDPAGELAPIIEEALGVRGGLLSVVVAVCGTEADPQDLDRQCRLLESAGAFVTRRSADAARFAVGASGAAMRPAAGADPEAIA